MICTATTMAQEASNNSMVATLGDGFYVAAMASFTFADHKRDANNGIGGALIIGRFFCKLKLSRAANASRRS